MSLLKGMETLRTLTDADEWPKCQRLTMREVE